MQGLSEGLACTQSRTPGPQPSPVLSEIRALSLSPGSDCRAGALRRVRTERVPWVLGPGTWVHAEFILAKSHAHLSGFPFLLEFSGSSLEAAGSGGREAWTPQRSGARRAGSVSCASRAGPAASPALAVLAGRSRASCRRGAGSVTSHVVRAGFSRARLRQL